jgi:adenosylcobinamide-GDP ribazoletransferase
VREKGLGSSIAEFIPKTGSVIISALCLVASAYFAWVGVLTAMIFIGTLIYLRHKFIQRIGGITGDTVGASIEICEAVSVLSLAVFGFYFPVVWL